MRQSSHAMRIAGSLSQLQNRALYVNTKPQQRYMPFQLSEYRTPTKVGGLPRIFFTLVDEDVSSITSNRRGVEGRGGGYTTHLQRSPSDDYYSRQIGDGYTRQLRRYDNDDDGVSSISQFHLRPGRFGGISRRYHNEFGRGPSSLLTSDANERRSRSPGDTADDIQTRQSHGVGSDDGYTRHLNRYDNHDGYKRHPMRRDSSDGYSRHLRHYNQDSPAASFQLRPGRFGGISQRYPSEFGCGQSTLLSGGHGFLSSSIAADDIETNQRSRTGVAAAWQQTDAGRSVLANLMNWRRERNSRWQATVDQMEIELPKWQRDVEPKERRDESFVNNDDTCSGANDDVTRQYTKQFPPSSLGDDLDVEQRTTLKKENR